MINLSFIEKLLNLKSLGFYDNLRLKNLENILLNDMGHKGIIRNDEPIIAISVSDQLQMPIFCVDQFINGFAVDFKILRGKGGYDFYFEIKPGFELGRGTVEKAIEKIKFQLNCERIEY